MLLKKTVAIAVLLFSFSLNGLAGVCSGVYFKNAKAQQLSSMLYTLAYVDINNDGTKDLAGTSATGTQYLYKGIAGGIDPAPVTIGPLGGYQLAIGNDTFADFNNDGLPDTVGASGQGLQNVAVFLNNGNNGFTQSTITAGGDTTQAVVRVIDLNGDNHPDLITYSGGVSFPALHYRINDGTDHFLPSVSIAGIAPSDLLINDLNNDGRNDLIYTTSNFPPKLNTRLATAKGNYAPAVTLNIYYGVDGVGHPILVDIDNDGRKEMVSGGYNNIEMSPQQSFFSVFKFDTAGNASETQVNITGLLAQTMAALGYYANEPRAGDFDGDGLPDIALFSRNVPLLVAKRTGGLTFDVKKYGAPSDEMPLLTDLAGDGKTDIITVNRPPIDLGPAASVTFRKNVCEKQGQNKFVDFDGNGESDIGFWRPSDGRWTFYDGGNFTGFNGNVNWGSGALGDIPLPQDYDGDGFSDFAVYRATTGYWYIYRSSDGQIQITQFGLSGDKPVPADYDGDGRADIGVFRPAEGNWYYLPSTAPEKLIGIHWGLDGDKPLPMDYNGDGVADIAIYRPSSGAWYIWTTNGAGALVYTFGGQAGDYPVPADYDNDGSADLAIFRPTTFQSGINWSIATSRNLYGVIVGTSVDKPFPVFTTNGVFQDANRFAAGPAAYRPSNSFFTGYTFQSFIYSGTVGSKNVSWILPID